MPTQEQINAANLELQIASDNYNRAQARIDQYNKLFNMYMNMSDEQKRNPKLASAMKNAIDDYNATKASLSANADRMNTAQASINEYNAQAAVQQASNRWGTRGRATASKETVTPEQVTTNPYLGLYSLYAQQIAEGKGTWDIYDAINNAPNKAWLSVWEIYNWMINAGLSDTQVNDFVTWWRDYLQNQVNTKKWTNNNIITTNTSGSLITPLNTLNTWTVNSWVTPLNTYTPKQTVSKSTRWRTVNPVSNFVSTVKSIPNKVNWTIQTLNTLPNTLNNVGKTYWAYKQASTWNWINGLSNNIQWWINFLNSLPNTLGAVNNTLKWVGTYRWL